MTIVVRSESGWGDEMNDKTLLELSTDLCDSAEDMLVWLVKNGHQWNFSCFDRLHADVKRMKSAIAEQGEG